MTHAANSTVLVTGSLSGLVAMHVLAVGTVLPLIAAQLQVPLGSAQAILTAYFLAYTVGLALYGALGNRFAARTLLLLGGTVFTTTSVAASLTRELPWLSAWRACEALGAGTMSASATALLAQAVSSMRLGRAFGWHSAIVYAGLALGAPVGGFLIDHGGWPAIFRWNALVAGIALGVAAVALPSRVAKGGAVAHGTERGSAPWLTAISLQSTTAELVCYGCAYSISFVVTAFAFRQHAWSATHIGSLLATQPLARLTVAPFAGTLTDRYGAIVPMAIGSLCLVAAVALLPAVDVIDSPTALVPSLIALGGGVGLFVPANSALLFARMPGAGVPMAATLLAVARHFGMALGTAVGAVISAR